MLECIYIMQKCLDKYQYSYTEKWGTCILSLMTLSLLPWLSTVQELGEMCYDSRQCKWMNPYSMCNNENECECQRGYVKLNNSCMPGKI